MMYLQALILFMLLVGTGSKISSASELPVCSNRVINEVTTRVVCTVGDTKCWLSKGGFCTDYVERMARRGQTGKAIQLKPISSEEVKKGDVAQFNARAHVAYVESVVKGRNGKPVAVNVAEYNYGACWVDEETMVTDKYKVVNKRAGIPLGSVDGGFLRP